ncbi:THO complex subunit 1 transcription elongation factor-domain-containing protein [Paraphoma chrysanthemicola]|uniref:THO complex subunit 1 transcription elongation factor-domain-containing protein n=1 Tax=Paraphoma chrysanthemicola TaxID=798071 RepID=A0A8K0W097_9PLEO|nr:THO complex subunit 1 transcription elongation factor-domain-containing protein [Paraphoma chrysanthemicola]
MTVHQEASQDAVALRLDYLLQRARVVKTSSSIDPPLQVSELVPETEPLFRGIEGEKEVRWLAVDSAAKGLFYAYLGTTHIEEPSFVNIWNLLDILQYCGDRELCSPQSILLLIEELLDSQSIEGCRTVFNFLESRREAIIAINSKNKDLVILRLCNELLRRLSRAEDPVFCGRVYIFMFQSFPLGDKSSVNLRGNFHVENVTTFEDYLAESSGLDDEMQIDDAAALPAAKSEPKSEELTVKIGESDVRKEGKSTTMDIDKLYPVFWSLQHSFSNPPRLFEADHFQHFQRSLEATLAKFKDVPTVRQAADSDRTKSQQERVDNDHDNFANTYNPKYLTSRDLFRLELSDLAFQRHILVQALILIEFLLALTEKAKSKPIYQNAQKAVQYSFTLREEDTEWALGIRTAIANYLQEGPDGKIYYRMVDTVLSRDKNWVRWKMENCQPFTRDRVSTKEFSQAKSAAQRAVQTKKLSKPMGVPSTLNFLYNTEAEKGLAQLRQTERFNVPNAESYAKKVRMTDLDLEMADTEEEKREVGGKKSSYVWKGLRLASKRQLSSFDRIEHGKGLEALQPATSAIEATGDDTAPTVSDDKGSDPQERHQSVEELRADQRSQVTPETRDS